MEVMVSVHISIWFSSLLVGILWLCTSYIVVIVVYNVEFHPLAQYPGPLWARVTPFYALFHAYRDDVHLSIHKCHAKYGWWSGTVLNSVQSLT